MSGADDYAATMSVFALAKAGRAIAGKLQSTKPESAAIIREICSRMIPTKIVPSRNSVRIIHQTLKEPDIPKAVAIELGDEAPAIKKTWCDQCESMVAMRCRSARCPIQN